MLAADITVLLIPLWILLGLVVLLGILALLGRIQGGRYLKPLFAADGEGAVPQAADGEGVEGGDRAHESRARERDAEARAACEAAPRSAAGAEGDVAAHARGARALLEMQEQQGGPELEAMNRQMRRRLEKQQKRR